MPERKKAQKVVEVSVEDKAELDGQDQMDMSHLDLRAGCIIRTMPLPGTDGLYLQHVDVGEAHPRTVVGECAAVNQVRHQEL